MIREIRNKEKLALYYEKFMQDGTIDPNVHPWVAESWQRCALRNLPHEIMPNLNRVDEETFAQMQRSNADVVQFVAGFYEQNKEHFNAHNLSLLVVDAEGYVLKNFALPFFQRSINDLQGSRVLESDIGTSSISIALEHNVPFLIFGPEMWIEDCHSGDACSAPICMDGKTEYIITFFSLDQQELPYDMLLSLLMSLKYALEQYLALLKQNRAYELIADKLPASIYWINEAGDIVYANAGGYGRLEGQNRLDALFLNSEHIPVKRAIEGTATIQKELTWITADRTYEDITSVYPLTLGSKKEGAFVVSMSIEELKTTIAHATGYSYRYSLYSMVGNSTEFFAMQHKAARLARGGNNILIQGEPGTGKQRLAHGIHQASRRAAAPLICVRCYEDNSGKLREELFGRTIGDDGHRTVAGKLELASGGTLFLDEVEKLPMEIGNEIADAVKNGILDEATGKRKMLDTRIIAACDSNLKRLLDKGLFSRALYDVILGSSLRVLPLRERIKDVEVISNHILSELSARYNMPIKNLSPEALRMLNNYGWPGNIKQLQTVVEKAFFHTTGTTIGVNDIKMPEDKTMEKSWKYDKEIFLAMWRSAGGNVSKLAHMLSVSRVTLYRYLRKYDLDTLRSRAKEK